jgi:peptidoglycan/LPS O-acetylase OafA/YrhL
VSRAAGAVLVVFAVLAFGICLAFPNKQISFQSPIFQYEGALVGIVPIVLVLVAVAALVFRTATAKKGGD